MCQPRRQEARTCELQILGLCKHRGQLAKDALGAEKDTQAADDQAAPGFQQLGLVAELVEQQVLRRVPNVSQLASTPGGWDGRRTMNTGKWGVVPRQRRLHVQGLQHNLVRPVRHAVHQRRPQLALVGKHVVA